MGKYLDKTGLQYFYNKLKDKFADKSALDSLTGAMQWKGQLSTLPTDLSTYSAGNVISVDNKEYVCTEVDGTKSWIELGDEGSYLLKTAAESTYLKKAAGEVKTDNLAGGAVTTAKLSDDIKSRIIFTPTTYELTDEQVSLLLKICNDPTGIPGLGSLFFNPGETLDGINIPAIGIEIDDEKTNISVTFSTLLANSDADIYSNMIGAYVSITAPNADDGQTLWQVSPQYSGVTSLSDAISAASGIPGRIIADKSITKAKLDTSVQTSLEKADNSLQIGETNTQSNQTVITTESTADYNNGLKVQNSSNGTEITPTGITFGLNTQPIGIYRKGTYELKLNSATGSSLTLSGVAAPVNNTDAVNKKYVDDKVSGFVKLGETNGASTSATTFKANTTGQALNIQASDSTTYLNGISVSVGTRSSETAAALTKTALVFGKQGTNYGRVEVNSNNKLQITGLDTPTSDTDAANKKYVDDSVTDKVDKTNVVSSLQAITIYTDNTTEHKAANLANIKAYEANLQALGVDVTKGYNAPTNIITAYSTGAGVLTVSESGIYSSVFVINGEYLYNNFINKTTGATTSYSYLTVGTVLTLQTTSKTVIGAINEVNAAKITGVKINGETKTPTSGVIDLGTISGGSGTTDTAMSDTSTNPVQNKVIKAYIDGLVGNAITQLSEI